MKMQVKISIEMQYYYFFIFPILLLPYFSLYAYSSNFVVALYQIPL